MLNICRNCRKKSVQLYKVMRWCLTWPNVSHQFVLMFMKSWVSVDVKDKVWRKIKHPADCSPCGSVNEVSCNIMNISSRVSPRLPLQSSWVWTRRTPSPKAPRCPCTRSTLSVSSSPTRNVSTHARAQSSCSRTPSPSTWRRYTVFPLQLHTVVNEWIQQVHGSLMKELPVFLKLSSGVIF